METFEGAQFISNMYILKQYFFPITGSEEGNLGGSDKCWKTGWTAFF